MLISKTTSRFWKAYEALEKDVQKQAREAYRFFRNDPQHPSLNFKMVVPSIPCYSIRVTRGYRAVGVLEDDTITWFWIGNHDDYERLIQSLL
jgi:hypothetical protein